MYVPCINMYISCINMYITRINMYITCINMYITCINMYITCINMYTLTYSVHIENEHFVIVASNELERNGCANQKKVSNLQISSKTMWYIAI